MVHFPRQTWNYSRDHPTINSLPFPYSTSMPYPLLEMLQKQFSTFMQKLSSLGIFVPFFLNPCTHGKLTEASFEMLSIKNDSMSHKMKFYILIVAHSSSLLPESSIFLSCESFLDFLRSVRPPAGVASALVSRRASGIVGSQHRQVHLITLAYILLHFSRHKNVGFLLTQLRTRVPTIFTLFWQSLLKKKKKNLEQNSRCNMNSPP